MQSTISLKHGCKSVKNLTFTFLKTNKAYYKKIGAGLLAMLFALILFDKALHQHEVVESSMIVSKTVVAKDANCLLCEFQLAADTDIAPSIQSRAVYIQPFNTLPFLTSSIITAFSYHLPERGPPAL